MLTCNFKMRIHLHKGEFVIIADTILDRDPPSITCNICLKSPLRTTGIPPNGVVAAILLVGVRISRNVLSSV